MEEDPVFYARFAALVQKAIDDYRQGRLSELDYLKKVETFLATVRQGHAKDLPDSLDGDHHAEARAFFGILGEKLAEKASDQRRVADADAVFDVTQRASALALDLEARIQPLKVVDWTNNRDAEKEIEDAIDDYLFEVRDSHSLAWDTAVIDDLLHRLLAVLRKQAGG